MGQRVDGELILVCPYCHRHAVRRDSTGIRFVHSVGMVKVGGRLELTEDACPSTPLVLPKRSVRK
jgi:ribosomal protein L37AE/L43A